jgi:hypothetical protein
MNCEWTKENIVLYVYDELADDAKFAFENHVRQCPGCRQELDSALEFKNGMAALPVQEVSASFLAANRMQLQESLEHAAQARSFLSSFVFDFAGWMHQIKLAPALTAVLLIIGFAGGVGTTYRMMAKGPDRNVIKDQPYQDAASVFDVDSVTRDANSNQVSIKYNTLQPQTRQGPVTDPYIRQLLLLGARNNQNSGVVLDSLALLSRTPEDNAVRDVLMYSLRYDKNPGVRLRALDGLKGYVRNDVQVRDAVVEALMHDTNAGIRQEAIGLLDPVKADSSVHQALQVLSERDGDKFIRAESRRYLASTPHLD